MGFFKGTEGKMEQHSLLGKEQRPLYQQMLDAAMGRSSGGAFGTAADYYRDLLSDDSSTFNAFAAPEMRNFRENIMPELAEQYAGMGAGGMQGSSFANSAASAGASLSERLGAIRAGLRQQGAAGLMGLGQFGLGQFNENVYRPGSQGFLQSMAPGIGAALGTMVGGPVGGAIGSGIGSMFGGSNPMSSVPQVGPLTRPQSDYLGGRR